MKTPSLFLSLSLPRSSSISLCSASSRCQRQSERRKGGSAAWQAGRLLAGWFGSLPTLCFPACLKLDLFPLLDFASVSNSFSCLSIYLQLFTVEYTATPREQKKKTETCQTLKFSDEKSSSFIKEGTKERLYPALSQPARRESHIGFSCF